MQVGINCRRKGQQRGEKEEKVVELRKVLELRKERQD